MKFRQHRECGIKQLYKIFDKKKDTERDLFFAGEILSFTEESTERVYFGVFSITKKDIFCYDL